MSTATIEESPVMERDAACEAAGVGGTITRSGIAYTVGRDERGRWTMQTASQYHGEPVWSGTYIAHDWTVVTSTVETANPPAPVRPEEPVALRTNGVECPHYSCRAWAGFPCRRPSGRQYERFHTVRENAAIRENRRRRAEYRTAMVAYREALAAQAQATAVPTPAPAPVETPAPRPRLQVVPAPVETQVIASVPDFVEALTSMAMRVAEAEVRAAGVKGAGEAAVEHADEIGRLQTALATLQEDWRELNRLLTHYAGERGWCSDYEAILRQWNERFQSGMKMLPRQGREGVGQEFCAIPAGWRATRY